MAEWSVKNRLTPRWCVLKSHRLLAGERPVLVRVRPPGSRQPMWPGDWLCRSVVTPGEREAKQQPVTSRETCSPDMLDPCKGSQREPSLSRRAKAIEAVAGRRTSAEPE